MNGRKYFAFSYYEQNGDNVTSYCHKTFPGWSHDVGVNPVNWACYHAEKKDSNSTKAKSYIVKDNLLMQSYYDLKVYKANLDFINRINENQKAWKAKSYEFMEGKTLSDMIKIS